MGARFSVPAAPVLDTGAAGCVPNLVRLAPVPAAAGAGCGETSGGGT